MIDRIGRDSILAAAILLFASLFFGSPVVAFSLALGSAVAIANFWLLAMIVTRLIERKVGWWKGAGLRVLFKFTVLLIFLWGTLKYTKVHPLAFVVGLSAVVLAIMLGAIMPERQTSSKMGIREHA